MFVKLFSDILQSSIWAEDPETKVVWITMLALCNQDGLVRATAPGISHMARVSLEKTQEALKIFESPDPNSRTTDNEGRRIERVDGGYLILNYLKYRELRDEDVRREKDRERQRRHREKWRDLSRSVTPCHAPSRQAEAEAEAEVEAEEEKEKVKRKKIGGFRPPALEDVKAFVEQEALGFDAEEWYYYWQGQGWKRKGGPIKDWQATARNWAKRKAPTPAKKQDVDEVAQYMKDHPGALFVPFG